MKKAVKSAVADIRFDEDVEILPPAQLPVAQAPAKLETRREFADVLAELWEQANQRFVEIGRYLNQAKASLPHGEFGEMIERDVPFSHRVANMLMRVAGAIDAGALPVDKLPASYATVYEVLTLSEPERQRAIEDGLIRPDIRREDIVAFKRSLRRPAPPPQSEPGRREALEAERQRLLARIADIERELAGITE